MRVRSDAAVRLVPKRLHSAVPSPAWKSCVSYVCRSRSHGAQPSFQKKKEWSFSGRGKLKIRASEKPSVE